MPTVRVNAADLAYDEAGTGQPVVFSHAGIADRWMWDHQLQQLATDHRVIRYDWRGYGDSSDAVGSFAHYRDLLGLLDALDIERAALVGCSMGGAYAASTSTRLSRRIDLADTGHLPPLDRPQEITAALRRFLGSGYRWAGRRRTRAW
jgi:pimeloyl-ACP methyl ester carboxylesterase